MVGFAILIALVAIFIDITAILYALILPIIYSFIAPKIVKDKWLNKGYINLDNETQGDILYNKICYVIIALCVLILAIQFLG